LKNIEDFYDENTQYEWDRLERHRTEFALTKRVLKDYLPPPPASILDVGGGPGRYALALAGQGYHVTLFDLSNRCLEFARQKAQESGVRLESYAHGNATDLSRYRSGAFDAVLLMGPLYHLLENAERTRAVGEAFRVLRPEGRVFASFITRYAPIRWAAKEEPGWPKIRELLETGVYRTPTVTPGFTSSYYAQPSEVKPLLEGEGFQSLELVACEGVVSMIEDKINRLEGGIFDSWVELNYMLGKDPSVQGAAEHLLYVGCRPSV